MPTVKPRLMITLDPEIFEIYKRFSAVESRRATSVISEILTQAAPSVEAAAVLLEKSKSASSLVRSELVGGVGSAAVDLKSLVSDLGQAALEQQAELDFMIDKIADLNP